jgi:hypothetical protein
MHSDIILVYLEGSVELVPVREDISSDVKVSCLDVILVEECVEVIRWLYEGTREDGNQNSVGGAREQRMTHWKRTVIKPDSYGTRRRVIYDIGQSTTVRARADLRASGVKTIVDRTRVRSVLCAWCEVGDFTSLNCRVEGVLPGLRHLARIRGPRRICGGPALATYLRKVRKTG